MITISFSVSINRVIGFSVVKISKRRWIMKKTTILSSVLSLALLTLVGCGGGGGGSTSSSSTGGSTTLTGVAAKGPISGGTINVYAIKNGQVDTANAIGTGTTAADGKFTISIPDDKKPTGPVVVEVSGGTFTDEASGTTGVALKTSLRAAISSIANGDKIAVTPFTHLAAKQVEGIGAFTEQEINDANQQIGSFFEVGDIIKSQPFDSTKGAPATASDDDKKYASALGVFSTLCNSRKGATKLEDALTGILDDLGKELTDNGGFTGTTLDDFNKAIDDFNGSGKDKSGASPLTKKVFTGGVLQLKTAGNLPANTAIVSLDLTITLPDSVTFAFDPVTGETAQGVVTPSSKATNGSVSVAKFTDDPTPATGGTLHLILINVQPGIDIGEFVHLDFKLKSGATLPDPADFAVTLNQTNGIVGGSKTDPAAANTDLTASGITIAKSVAGL